MDALSFLHKRKMKELKGQDRNDYLLKNAPLIFAHYRVKKKRINLISIIDNICITSIRIRAKSESH